MVINGGSIVSSVGAKEGKGGNLRTMKQTPRNFDELHLRVKRSRAKKSRERTNIWRVKEQRSHCRLGDDSNDFGTRRLVYSIRVEEVKVDDDRWHAVTIHFVSLILLHDFWMRKSTSWHTIEFGEEINAFSQHWENVKLTMDHAYGFSIMNQRSTGFGDLGKSSDVFVGGVPKVSYPIITLFIFRNSITFQPLV